MLLNPKFLELSVLLRSVTNPVLSLAAIFAKIFQPERKTFLPNPDFIDYPTWTDILPSIGL
jgi:hypothetical protein